MGIKRGVLELNSRAMVNLEIRNMVGLSVFGSIEWACESFVNWEGGKIRWTINFSMKKKIRLIVICVISSFTFS